MTNKHTMVRKDLLGVPNILVIVKDNNYAWNEDSLTSAVHCVMNQMSLKAAKQKHGNKTKTVASKELLKLHHRNVLTLIHGKLLSQKGKKLSVEAIMTVKEKEDSIEIKEVKGRMCADGRK